MSDQHPQLWLIRHGETEWSATGRHTGRTDIPLTPLGERQAAALGRHLAERKFALVLCSPLGRARETCRIAGYLEQAIITDDLREWDYGRFEGRTTVDIRKEIPGWTIWTWPVQGGESVEQVGARVKRIIERAVASGGGDGDVALFAHGHVLRILAACYLGLPPIDGRLLALSTAAISRLGYEHETRVITAWNQDWHLRMDETQT